MGRRTLLYELYLYAESLGAKTFFNRGKHHWVTKNKRSHETVLIYLFIFCYFITRLGYNTRQMLLKQLNERRGVFKFHLLNQPIYLFLPCTFSLLSKYEFSLFVFKWTWQVFQHVTSIIAKAKAWYVCTCIYVSLTSKNSELAFEKYLFWRA